MWLVHDAKAYCEELSELIEEDPDAFPGPSDEEACGMELTDEQREADITIGSKCPGSRPYCCIPTRTCAAGPPGAPEKRR